MIKYNTWNKQVYPWPWMNWDYDMDFCSTQGWNFNWFDIVNVLTDHWADSLWMKLHEWVSNSVADISYPMALWHPYVENWFLSWVDLNWCIDLRSLSTVKSWLFCSLSPFVKLQNSLITRFSHLVNWLHCTA